MTLPGRGAATDFYTVFRDGDIMRMYYMAAELTNEDGTKFEYLTRPIFACYAESLDGIHWVKPELGLFEFAGLEEEQHRVVRAEAR